MKKTGLERETTDQFYTCNAVVKLVMNVIEKKYDLTRFNIIEPSAGNGSFIRYFDSQNYTYTAYDIDPKHDSIIKKDFLTIDTSLFNKMNTIIIGNPPFGRQSSLAKKFIKKSEQIANIICFILPKSFKKTSMQKAFDKYYHLEFELDLPRNAFIIDKKEYDVPCIFQIWELKTTPRIEKTILEPVGYEFVKKNDNPDISFRRVGIYAGKADKNCDKSIESHYFIKFNDRKNINDIIIKLNNEKYDDNTVGPRSISKQELIERLNPIMQSISQYHPNFLGNIAFYH